MGMKTQAGLPSRSAQREGWWRRKSAANLSPDKFPVMQGKYREIFAKIASLSLMLANKWPKFRDIFVEFPTR